MVTKASITRMPAGANNYYSAWGITKEEIILRTEVPRTYEITTPAGGHFFKMYKPTEARKIFRKKGWTGKCVSKLSRRY